MRTSVESKRGCGFRKPGGLYLCSDGIGIDCDLLPFVLDVCPCCGAGIKPSRGWTWVRPDELLPHHTDPAVDGSGHYGCPLNEPGRLGERAGLLWIGEVFYPTPQSWVEEGRTMGFSRRIPAVPRGFEVGTTWVLVAHRKAVTEMTDDGPTFHPAVFHIWRPDRIEYVVRGDETDEVLEALEHRGIELVKVIPAEQTELEEVPV